jgi:hypothetical protein
MPLNRAYIILSSILISIFANFLFDTSLLEFISFFLFSYFILDFIDSIGKTYEILHLPIIFAILQCLIMPIITYRLYNDDDLVIALRYDMSVDQDRYFSYMLPAVFMMIFGMKIPLYRGLNNNAQINTIINSLKLNLKSKSTLGIVFMCVGLSSGFLQAYVPGEFGYVMYLFNKLFYIGILYIFYSDNKNKKTFILSGLILLLIQTIATGIFGELVYTLMLGFILIILGNKISFIRKLFLFLFGLIIIFLLQSIKAEYRKATWVSESASVNKSASFFSLLIDKIQNSTNILDKEEVFPLVVRINQGMIIGKVLNYVPQFVSFFNGETIFNSLAASFVPRFLWPDKPIAGGKLNMFQFTGLVIEGYSMNVSPFGEAYANFNVVGGVMYMFIYGLFFNIIYTFLIYKSRKIYSLILWFPALFINSIQIETDTLMTVNSLIKTLLFVALIYWVFKRFLRIQL